MSAARGALAAAALVAALGAPARATTCARPDLIDAVPPDMATNVPPNAALSAHYDPSADYGNEDVVLTPDGGTPEAVKVTWDGTQGLLTFTPDSSLPPGGYTIAWPSLRGLNTAAPGLGATIHFTVGTVDDAAPPDFAGLTGISWDLERQTNDCTDSLENRMDFTLSLATAADDGGRANLTLVVFQTQGSGGSTDGGSVPVLTRAMPPAGETVVVKLPVSDATGHVCFAAIARDLTGKVSDSGSVTVCAETTAPPFFRGCALAPTGRGGVLGALAGLAMALAAIARRR